MTRILFPLFALVLLAAAPARADEPTAAPFAGHCFGDGTSTCLVPELTFDVGRMALTGPNAGKFEAGAIPVGAGYAALFGYDQWWASGPAIHAVFAVGQASDNYLQVSAMATLARYAHVGVLWSAIGSERTWYLAGGLTLPIDLVTTQIAKTKTAQVRASKAVRP